MDGRWRGFAAAIPGARRASIRRPRRRRTRAWAGPGVTGVGEFECDPVEPRLHRSVNHRVISWQRFVAVRISYAHASRALLRAALAVPRPRSALRRGHPDHRRQYRRGAASGDEYSLARQPLQRRDLHAHSSFDQIKEMPRGATVFMSLGTNDAVGGALDVRRRASRRSSRPPTHRASSSYWVGPPCVIKPWQVHSKKLDEILQSELEGTSVDLCQPAGSRVLRPFHPCGGWGAF